MNYLDGLRRALNTAQNEVDRWVLAVATSVTSDELDGSLKNLKHAVANRNACRDLVERQGNI